MLVADADPAVERLRICGEIAGEICVSFIEWGLLILTEGVLCV
jgi:hypothetical protein